MAGKSPHIIVTEVPPGFLRRKNIRTHFSKFGNIVRLSIQSSYCVLTFENAEQAQNAIDYGTEWKDMPMKIDFTANHDPFGSDDAIMNEELNWFAPDEGVSDKPRVRPSKSKLEFKSSEAPPKKIGKRVVLVDEDEAFKPSEDKHASSKRSESSKVCKKHKERLSASAKFLEEMRNKIKEELKEEESKLSRSGEDSSSRSRHSGERRRTRSSDSKPVFKVPYDSTSQDSPEEGEIPESIDDYQGKSILKTSEAGHSHTSEKSRHHLRMSEAVKKDRESSPMSVDSYKSEEKITFMSPIDKRIDRDSSPISHSSKSEGRSLLRGIGEKRTARDSSPLSVDYFKSENKIPLRSSIENRRDRDLLPSEGKSLLRSIDEKRTAKESSPMSVDYPSSKPEFKMTLRSSLEKKKRERDSSPASYSVKSKGKSVLKISDIKKTTRESSPAITDYFKSDLRGNEEKLKKSEASPFMHDFSKSEGKSVMTRSSEDKKKEVESSPVVSDVEKSEEISSFSRNTDEGLFSKVIEESKLTKAVDDNKSTKTTDDYKVHLKSNEASLANKFAVTLKDRLDLLEERDKQLRQKPEMSGMNYVPQGTCPDMCPEKERILREVRNMVAPYEALPDGRMDHGKAVKEYTRSSADQGKPLPHELRPEPVLTMTMSYLINCIISRIDEVEDENLHNWYDFCWGRLRAVRKDIIQQALCDENTVMILEQCARFHIACYDRLWGLSKSLFDDKLNTETLNNCLTSLMNFYEDLHHHGTVCPNEAEFNAYLILLNMNNAGFLVSQFDINLKQSPVIKEAVRIHLAYHNNMFATYFKLIKNTSYLNACLAQRFFQHVRTEALNTIVRSHCTPNKFSSLSAKFLMNMLKLDSVADCVNFCESAGLNYNQEDKIFKINRSYFDISQYIYEIETPSSIIVNKRVPIAEAVTGSKRTLPIYLKHVVHNSFTDEGRFKESSIDASDQEEKMLRDNVERKLLLSHLKTTLVQDTLKKEPVQVITSTQEVDMEEFTSSAPEDNDNEDNEDQPMEELYSENENSTPYEENADIEKSEAPIESDSGDSNNTSSVLSNITNKYSPPKTQPGVSLFPSTFTTFSFTPLEKDENKNSEPKLFQERSPLRQIDEKDSSDFQTDHKSTPQPEAFEKSKKGLSPKPLPHNTSPFFTGVSKKEEFSPDKEKNSPKETLVTQEQAIIEKRISPKFQRQVSDTSSRIEDGQSVREKYKGHRPMFSRLHSHGSSTKWERSFPREPIKKIERSPKKSGQFDKLRKKLSENMKKISARKYLRLWKEKAAKMKSSREFETMVIYHLSANDYLKLWGRPHLKPSYRLAHQVKNRNKSNVLVHVILHSDFLNYFDKDIRKVGQMVVNILGEASVKKADSWGNIAQPNPVFWKLVFALPSPPEGGTTFGMKLRDWCKVAFYRKKDSKLLEAELHMSESGVPVVLSVQIVEGLEKVKTCANLSALVVVRAKDWESPAETRSRIEKLASLSNHPIPVAVLNVGKEVEHVEVTKTSKIKFFEECPWESSKTTCNVLCDLARNIHLFNVKVRPFCTLVEISSEKLMDLLHLDSFLHDGLQKALANPNNVFLVYNALIDKIEAEIKECQVGNYFGTAMELKKDLVKYNNPLMFPDNYNDPSFVEALSLRCNKCKLRHMKIDFSNERDFVSFFKNYCDDIGCMNIFKTLMRFLNLPDEDSGIKIVDHLQSINWLRFAETLIQEVLSSNLLRFNVVYREDVIRRILDSHFWLESQIIKL